MNKKAGPVMAVSATIIDINGNEIEVEAKRRELADGSFIQMPGVIPGCDITREYPSGIVVALISRMFGAIDLAWQPTLLSVGPEHQWTYTDPIRAETEFLDWDGNLEHEPQGWIRHRPSCWRRPNGNAEDEYIRE